MDGHYANISTVVLDYGIRNRKPQAAPFLPGGEIWVKYPAEKICSQMELILID